jgi:hypothetical protein
MPMSESKTTRCGGDQRGAWDEAFRPDKRMHQKYRNRSGLSLGIQGQRSLTQAGLVALSLSIGA